ncbi:MAG: hypothetical protein HY716_14310 [Planctomycetes bacterium]|nr:hypothetical protein [Planctomycetota bacterium]
MKASRVRPLLATVVVASYLAWVAADRNVAGALLLLFACAPLTLLVVACSLPPK